MLDYKDVNLISREISEVKSRDDISISTSIFGLSLSPIIASPMKNVCDGKVAKIMEENNSLGIIHRFMSIDEQVNELYIHEISNAVCAIGINGDYLDRYKELINHGVGNFCIDVANSSSVHVKNTIKTLLDIHPAKFIVGNAISVEGVHYYDDIPEVEGIRCGVAGGAACTTRNTTGLYHPMVSLLLECRNSNKKIIADGGIKEPRDYCIAMACGADFIMIGGLIAKTKDAPSESIVKDGKTYKLYHGSASYENQKNYKEFPKYIEGRTLLLECDGESLSDLLRKFDEGLRSSMSYCNAFNLEQFIKNSILIRV